MMPVYAAVMLGFGALASLARIGKKTFKSSPGSQTTPELIRALAGLNR